MILLPAVLFFFACCFYVCGNLFPQILDATSAAFIIFGVSSLVSFIVLLFVPPRD